MSRPLRIEYTGAWYHIMNRGRRGDNVFEGMELSLWLFFIGKELEMASQGFYPFHAGV